MALGKWVPGKPYVASQCHQEAYLYKSDTSISLFVAINHSAANVGVFHLLGAHFRYQFILTAGCIVQLEDRQESPGKTVLMLLACGSTDEEDRRPER